MAASMKRNPKEPNSRIGTLKNEFTPGKKYRISDAFRRASIELVFFEFIYCNKIGVNHVFKNAAASWTRCFTDAQLLGKIITPLE